MPLKKVTSFHIVFDNEWNNYRVNRLDRIKKWYFLEEIIKKKGLSQVVQAHLVIL